MRQVERSRSSLWYEPNWIDYKICILKPGRGTFTKTVEISTSSDFPKVISAFMAFPNPLFQSVSPFVAPIEVLHSIEYVGTTSYLWKTQLIEHESQKAIVNSSALCVYMDMESRLPRQIPQDISDSIKSAIGKTDKPTRITLQDAPMEAYTHQMTAAFNDLDSYGHVNNVNFSKYCIEGAFAAFQDKFYKGLLRSFEGYFLDSFYLDLISECDYKDKVVCKTWQDEVDLKCLYFQLDNITKGKVMAKARMRLKEKEEEKKTLDSKI